MAKTVSKDNLGYLGEEYQMLMVKCFLEDQDFFIGINHIVDQNMFTDPYVRRIVGFIKERFNKTEQVPTYTDLKLYIRTQVSNAVDVNTLLGVLKEMFEMEMTSIDLIEGECEKFFKQQNIIRAINKSQEIIKKGDVNQYPFIEELFAKALEGNMLKDRGFRLFENVKADLKEDYRKTIPTGAKELDEALFGGLGKGELGLVICPLGTGKTSATTGFAAAAATTKEDANNGNGYKVLHFFFEDDEVNIRRKYYGYMTGIDACELSKPNNIETVYGMLTDEDSEVRKMLRENIICERLSSGEVTASDIKQKIKKRIATGFKPDVVIIDYFECLKAERDDSLSSSEWTKEGITMRKLESTANELNIAIWVPIQGSKDSIGAEVVGLAMAGGSVKKTQIGHVAITFAQTPEMKEQSKLNVYIGKLRAARVGKTKFLGVTFNNGTCRFDFSTCQDNDFNSAVDGNGGYGYSQSVQLNSVAKATSMM